MSCGTLPLLLLLQFVTVVLPQFRDLLESTAGNDRLEVIGN